MFVEKVDEIWNLVRIEAIKAQGSARDDARFLRAILAALFCLRSLWETAPAPGSSPPRRCRR